MKGEAEDAEEIRTRLRAARERKRKSRANILAKKSKESIGMKGEAEDAEEEEIRTQLRGRARERKRKSRVNISADQFALQRQKSVEGMRRLRVERRQADPERARSWDKEDQRRSRERKKIAENEKRVISDLLQDLIKEVETNLSREYMDKERRTKEAWKEYHARWHGEVCLQCIPSLELPEICLRKTGHQWQVPTACAHDSMYNALMLVDPFPAQVECWHCFKSSSDACDTHFSPISPAQSLRVLRIEAINRDEFKSQSEAYWENHRKTPYHVYLLKTDTSPELQLKLGACFDAILTCPEYRMSGPGVRHTMLRKRLKEWTLRE
jgi:hypothetical protein